MKICPECESELFDDAVICTKCGSAQEKAKPQPTKDRMNIFWFIISFLVWWVGILLFIYFKKDDPKKAKVCISGTISAFAVLATVFVGCHLIGLIDVLFFKG